MSTRRRRLTAVVVAVEFGQPEAGIERPGRRVARFDLQAGTGGGAVARPEGESVSSIRHGRPPLVIDAFAYPIVAPCGAIEASASAAEIGARAAIGGRGLSVGDMAPGGRPRYSSRPSSLPSADARVASKQGRKHRWTI